MEKKSLRNKRILITRSEEQAQPFVDLLERRGAIPVVFATIKIVPPRDWGELDGALGKLSDYNTVIFTSVNGVRYFFQRMEEKGLSTDLLKGKSFCAIGPRTGAGLEEFGFRTRTLPEKYQAESVIKALEEDGIAGRKFLLPRAEEARELLPQEIQKRGGVIDVVTVYRTERAVSDANKLHDLLDNREIDAVTFTSSSTVKHFVSLISPEHLSKVTGQCVVACIGPITAETAQSYGMKPDIVAKEYTIEGLTEAMEDFFARSGRFEEGDEPSQEISR